MNIFEEAEPTILDTDDEVGAVSVRFEQEMLTIELNDGRQIGLPFHKIKWLNWLANATPEQRTKWTIEPRGYAIWWDDLDDGFEVVHALDIKPMFHHQKRSEQVAEFA